MQSKYWQLEIIPLCMLIFTNGPWSILGLGFGFIAAKDEYSQKNNNQNHNDNHHHSNYEISAV